MTGPDPAFRRTPRTPEGKGFGTGFPPGAGAALAVRPGTGPRQADRLAAEHSRRTLGAKLSTYA